MKERRIDIVQEINAAVVVLEGRMRNVFDWMWKGDETREVVEFGGIEIDTTGNHPP